MTFTALAGGSRGCAGWVVQIWWWRLELKSQRVGKWIDPMRRAHEEWKQMHLNSISQLYNNRMRVSLLLYVPGVLNGQQQMWKIKIELRRKLDVKVLFFGVMRYLEWKRILTLPLPSWGNLGQVTQPSEMRYNSTYFIRPLWRLNKMRSIGIWHYSYIEAIRY